MSSLLDINLDLDCLTRVVDAVAGRFSQPQSHYQPPVLPHFQLTRNSSPSRDEKHPSMSPADEIESESDIGGATPPESDRDEEIAREPPAQPIVLHEAKDQISEPLQEARPLYAPSQPY